MPYHVIIENDAGKWEMSLCEIVNPPERGVRSFYRIRDTRGYFHKVLFIFRENSDGFMEAVTVKDWLQGEINV